MKCDAMISVLMLCPYLPHLFLCLCRVEQAYRRIVGPVCVTVDASPSADQVLREVQLLIKTKCHL